VNLIGINRNNHNNNIELTDILEDAVDLVENSKPIPSTSSEPIDQYFTSYQTIDKGKEVIESSILTSPSLENLNSTAQES